MSFRRRVNNFVFHCFKRRILCQEVYLREILLNYFIQKKSAAKLHKILVKTYSDHALSETTCRNWSRRFENNDFDVEDKERSGAAKRFEDEELEELLHEDLCQAELAESLGVDYTTVSKRLKALRMIQKQRHCVSYELKPRNFERRLVMCEQLLQRQKRKYFFASYRDGEEM